MRDLILSAQFKGTALTTAAAATAVSVKFGSTATAFTASSGSTTTVVSAAMGATDIYSGRFILFTGGPNTGKTAQIISYNTGTTTATFLYAMGTAVANTDTFVLQPDYASMRAEKVLIMGSYLMSGSNAGTEQYDLSVKVNSVERFRFTERAQTGFQRSFECPLPFTSADGDIEIVFDKNGANWSNANRFFVHYSVV